MSFSPDIIVTKPDSPEVLLLAEIKAGTNDVQAAEAQLKEYMVHVGCPVGLLVTSERAKFYRNRYTGYEPQTVETIAECATSELVGPAAEGLSYRTASSYLEHRVEQWLEGLQSTAGAASWPPAVREAVEAHILPAVIGGVVRATGP
jgi:hypothetical protein